MQYKNQTRVTIEGASNGIVVCVCQGHNIGEDMGEDKKYVYKTIDEAVKSIPALFSVAEAEKKPDNEKDVAAIKADMEGDD